MTMIIIFFFTVSLLTSYVDHMASATQIDNNNNNEGTGIAGTAAFSQGAWVKNNFCSTFSSIMNFADQSVSTSNALMYQNITVGYNLDTPSYWLTFDHKNKPTAGFMFTLFTVLAQRGLFTVNWQQVNNISNFRSTTQFLTTILPLVDIYGGKLIPDSAYRRDQAYISSTVPLVDQSIVLVTKSIDQVPFVLLAFLLPFSSYLWLYILAMVGFHGVITYLFENYSPKRLKNSGTPLNIFKSVYVSFLQFVDGEDRSVQPTSTGSRTVKIGFQLFCLMIASAYIANLAEVLFQPAIPVPTFADIEDAISKKTVICAMNGPFSWCMDCTNGSTAYSVISQYYPEVQLMNVDSLDPFHLMAAVNSGKCAGAAMYKTEWDAVSNVQAANPNCEYVQVGPPIRPETGSIPVPVDYTNQCTSVIELVLSTIITSLKQDGTMDFIYQRKLANYWNKSCKLQPAFVPVEPLDYNQTAGVFLGYCAFICVTIVIGSLTVVVGYWHEMAAKKKTLQRSETRADLRAQGLLRINGGQPGGEGGVGGGGGGGGVGGVVEPQSQPQPQPPARTTSILSSFFARSPKAEPPPPAMDFM